MHPPDIHCSILKQIFTTLEGQSVSPSPHSYCSISESWVPETSFHCSCKLDGSLLNASVKVGYNETHQQVVCLGGWKGRMTSCLCEDNTHVHTHKQMYFMWKDWTLMSNTWQSDSDSELSENPTWDKENSLFHFFSVHSHIGWNHSCWCVFFSSWVTGVHWYSTFAPLVCLHILFSCVHMLLPIAHRCCCPSTAVSHSRDISRARYRWVLI